MSIDLNITYCTYYDDGFSELGDYTSDHNRKVLSDTASVVIERNRLSDRAPAWDKCLVILRELPKSDYVVWIDSDAIVLSASRLLKLIQDNSSSFMLSQTAALGFNSGLLIFKNCDMSYDFLYNVWAQDQYVHDNHTWDVKLNGKKHRRWWDQGAFRHVLGYDGPWRIPANKTYDPEDKLVSIPKGSKFPIKRNPYRESMTALPYGEFWCTPEDLSEYPNTASLHAVGKGSPLEKKDRLEFAYNTILGK